MLDKKGLAYEPPTRPLNLRKKIKEIQNSSQN